jgi:hypothetical protein
MRRRLANLTRKWVWSAVVTAVAVAHLSAQAPVAPAAASPAKTKELASALTAKKLEAFALSEAGSPGRYVAVLHQPGIQILVVSAAYERSSDMDYRFYQKDYMNAYLDLRSGMLSKDRVIIEDAGVDGLVALPGKSPLYDSITVGADRLVFDGMFQDPKKKDTAKKLTQADYMQKFADADAKYTRLLGLLIDGLAKAGTE